MRNLPEMKVKDLLISHYNRKYAFNIQKEIKQNIVNRYPRDRYEVAIYYCKAEGKALEIGAGSGNILASLKDKYEEYVATELSNERVKYLKEFFGGEPTVKIIHNDIEEKNLNFPDNYFDTIIMIAVIEHLIEPLSVLEYCYRILKPGGGIADCNSQYCKVDKKNKVAFWLFSFHRFSAGRVNYL